MTDEGIDYSNVYLRAGEHAIESVSFSLAFGEPLTRVEFTQFSENEEKIGPEFTFIKPMDRVTFQIQNMQPSARHEKEGKELTEFSKSGEQLWSANFFENIVSVTCHKYTRWKEISPIAFRRLRLLLECVDPKKEVTALDFSVKDAFASKFQEQPLIPSVIFRAGGAYVSSQILESEDARWDIQQGWFEPLVETAKKLTRLDCKSVLRNEDCITTIENVVSMRHDHPRKTLSEYLDNGGDLSLEKLFEKFHSDNKEILRELLVDELLVKMKLKEENGG